MTNNEQSEESSGLPPSKELTEAYLLHLADNALILGQRNAEWCGHGPVLEQDIAITNISLDLIGQARNFYQYAALLIGDGCDEDKLAYLRSEREFKNCLLVELPRGDWAQTILRQFLFSAYQYLLYTELQKTEPGQARFRDEQLAAIAAKALKEVSYHLRWSSEWVIRLGDGTEESHTRIQNAVNELWPYTGELFNPAYYEKGTAGTSIGIDPSLLKKPWEEKVNNVFAEAAIVNPNGQWMQTGGKEGKHTEHLGYILAEMQYMQRAYPDSKW
ncbi:MAG: Phenylacetic acid degradation protein [Chitinophagaceae bacterium]|nr:Phenylacetic acid degradation protein [Chitinophagaceae bacterium]